VMSPWMTATGSRPSSSGHFAHRGRPARSREATVRFSPQAAHGSSCVRAQGEQYQSCPARWKPLTFLPHCAQAGSEVSREPASCRATSRSATARGAGDLPSASTSGRPARARARRRDLARPPATADTASRTCSRPSPGPASITSSVISPAGSDMARS
jgi:hypothetical protein